MKEGWRTWLQHALTDAKMRHCPSDTPAGGFSPKGLLHTKQSHCPKPRKHRQGTLGIPAISIGMAAWGNWTKDIESEGGIIFDGPEYWPQPKGGDRT